MEYSEGYPYLIQADRPLYKENGWNPFPKSDNSKNRFYTHFQAAIDDIVRAILNESELELCLGLRDLFNVDVAYCKWAKANSLLPDDSIYICLWDSMAKLPENLLIELNLH